MVIQCLSAALVYMSVFLPLCAAAVEAARVMAVLSFLMAVSTAALCLVFALCWTSETVRSYSNTRSLLMAGQALYPTTLLLIAMVCTGEVLLKASARPQLETLAIVR